uniref:VWFA domain-containing protein n=2 Tax=Plectus sambesii TaxID=2011161 RepID=A0A914VLC8_9BILA
MRRVLATVAAFLLAFPSHAAANYEKFTYGIDVSLHFDLEFTRSSSEKLQIASEQIHQKLSQSLSRENFDVDILRLIDAKKFHFEEGTIFYAKISSDNVISRDELETIRFNETTMTFGLLIYGDSPRPHLDDDDDDDDDEMSASSLQAGTCQNGGFPLSNGSCNCPAYIGAALCTDWQCLNGGFRNGNAPTCVCPPGYLGSHCEPVQCKPLASQNFDVRQTTLTYLFTANMPFLQYSMQSLHDATAVVLNTTDFYNYQFYGIDTKFPFSKVVTTRQEFLNNLEPSMWSGSLPPDSCNSPHQILNAIYTLLTSGKAKPKSPLYVFVNVPATDYYDINLENQIVQIAIAFQVRIHVIGTYLQGCDGFSSNLWFTNPAYMVLGRIARRTFGQFVPIDYTFNGNPTGNSTAEVVTAMLNSQRLSENPDILASGFFSDCRFAARNDLHFNLDSTSFFVSISTNVPANDFRYLLPGTATLLVQTGNWRLYRVDDVGFGQASVLFGTYTIGISCAYQVWASSPNHAFLSFTPNELSDANSPIPPFGTPNRIVAHLTSSSNSLPVSIAVKVNDSTIFQGSGSLRNSCQFEYDFGSWSCGIPGGGDGSILIEAADSSGNLFSRVYPIFCNQGGSLSPTTTPSTASSTSVPPINCTNYGTPLGGQCVCPPDFTGPNCQCPVCRNSGSCIIVNDTSGYCNCSVGYAGKNCLNFECTQNKTSPSGPVTNVSLGIVILNSASMMADAADSIMQGMDSFFNYADATYSGYYQNFVVTKFNSTASPTDVYTNRYLAWRDMQISDDPDTACDAQQTLLALSNTISHPAFVPGSQVFVFTNTLFGDASNIDALQKIISQKRPKLMFFILADSGACSDGLLSNPDAMTVYRQLAAITGGFAARISKTDLQPLIQAMAPISYQAQTMSQMDVDDCRIATKETLILSRFGQTSFAINVIAIGHFPVVIVQDIITNQNITHKVPDVTSYNFNLFQLTIPQGLHSVYFSSLYIAEAEHCQFRMFESSNYQIDYGFTDDPNDDLTSTYPIFGKPMYAVAHQLNGFSQDPLSNSGSITLSVYSSSAAETAGASNYVYTTTSSGRGSCGYETYFKYPWTCLAPGQFFFMRFVNSFNGNFFIRSAVTQCRKDSEQIQCLNGGTPNGNACTCTAGLWSGTYCEIPICYNGGSATAENLMYCACPPTYSGAHCENTFCSIVNQNAGLYDTNYKSLTFVVQRTNSIQGHFNAIFSQIQAYKAMTRIQQYSLVLFSDQDVTPVVSTSSLSRFQEVVTSTLTINPPPNDPVSSVKSIEALTAALQLQTANKGFIVLITDTAPDQTFSAEDFYQQLQLSQSTVEVLSTNITLASSSTLLRQVAVSSGGQFVAALSTLLNAQLGVVQSNSAASCPASNSVSFAVDSQTTAIYILAYGQTIQSVKNAAGADVTGTMLATDGQNMAIGSYNTANSFGTWTITLAAGGSGPCSFQVLANSQLQISFGFSTDPKSDFPLAALSSLGTTNFMFHLNPTSFPIGSFLQAPSVTTSGIQGGIVGSTISTSVSNTRMDCSFELTAPLTCDDGGVQLFISGSVSSGGAFQRTVSVFCRQPKTCMNGGTIVNGMCQCSSWWTGFDCRSPVCINGGTVDRYACNCPVGNYGDHCELTNQLSTTTSTSSTTISTTTVPETTTSTTLPTTSTLTSITSTTPLSTVSSMTQSPSLSCNLKQLKYDFTLLIDTSDAVSTDDFTAMKTMLIDLVSEYNISNSTAKFIIFFMDSGVDYEDAGFNWGTQTQEELVLTIQELKQNLVTAQNLENALSYIQRYMKGAGYPGDGYRPGVTGILLYITGTTRFTGLPPYDVASSLRSQGVNMAAIQFEPNANTTYLSEVVGGDDCVFSALDSSSRKAAVLWFQNKTCNAQFCTNQPSSASTSLTSTTIISTTTSTTTASETTTSILTTPPSTTSTTQGSISCDLTELHYDIYLIIDCSEGISDADFAILKEKLIAFVSAYTVSDSLAQFMVLTVGDNAQISNTEFHSGQTLEDDVMFAIDNIQQSGESGQSLYEAIEMVESYSIRLGSKSAKQMAVYFTGNTNFDSEPFTLAQHAAAFANMNFVAIQYGAGANVDSLSYLVGGTACVYQAVTDEARNGLVSWLQAKTCNADFCIISLTTLSGEPSSTTPMSTVSSMTQSPSLSCNLKQLKYDVTLLIDNSNAVSPEDFIAVKTMLIDLVSEYNISQSAAKFAVFVVSSDGDYQYSGFNDGTQTQEELLLTIQELRQDLVTEQNLESALLFIRDFMKMAGQSGDGYRPGVTGILLYITGTTRFTGLPPYDVASSLRSQGVNMAAIQFEPNANTTYLSEVVGGDDCRAILHKPPVTHNNLNNTNNDAFNYFNYNNDTSNNIYNDIFNYNSNNYNDINTYNHINYYDAYTYFNDNNDTSNYYDTHNYFNYNYNTYNYVDDYSTNNNFINNYNHYTYNYFNDNYNTYNNVNDYDADNYFNDYHNTSNYYDTHNVNNYIYNYNTTNYFNNHYDAIAILRSIRRFRHYCHSRYLSVHGAVSAAGTAHSSLCESALLLMRLIILQLDQVLSDFVDGYTFGASGTQFMAILARNTATSLATFTAFSKGQEFVDAVIHSVTSQVSGSLTTLDSALKLIIDSSQSAQANGYRPNAARLIVLMMANNYTDNGFGPVVSANSLRSSGNFTFLEITFGTGVSAYQSGLVVGGRDCVSEANSQSAQWLQYKTCTRDFCPKPTTTSTTLFPPSPTTPASCNLQMVTYDVVLLLDSSDLIGESNFNAAKQAIIDYASQYAWTNTKFALVMCTTQAVQYNTFASFTNFNDFKNMIQGLQFSPGYPFANFAKGITTADQLFMTGNGHRPSAYPMVVFIVGSSIMVDARGAAQNLRYNKGVFMAGITISPTGSTIADLGQLTGGDSCASSAADSSQLKASFDWLAAKTCSLQFCDTNPAGR